LPKAIGTVPKYSEKLPKAIGTVSEYSERVSKASENFPKACGGFV